ncbi:MAG: hypothetical protein Q9159_006805 [Coniocarpon cinnabarinum]
MALSGPYPRICLSLRYPQAFAMSAERPPAKRARGSSVRDFRTPASIYDGTPAASHESSVKDSPKPDRPPGTPPLSPSRGHCNDPATPPADAPLPTPFATPETVQGIKRTRADQSSSSEEATDADHEENHAEDEDVSADVIYTYGKRHDLHTAALQELLTSSDDHTEEADAYEVVSPVEHPKQKVYAEKSTLRTLLDDHEPEWTKNCYIQDSSPSGRPKSSGSDRQRTRQPAPTRNRRGVAKKKQVVPGRRSSKRDQAREANDIIDDKPVAADNWIQNRRYDSKERMRKQRQGHQDENKRRDDLKAGQKTARKEREASEGCESEAETEIEDERKGANGKGTATKKYRGFSDDSEESDAAFGAVQQV